jgi:hypothetical protein
MMADEPDGLIVGMAWYRPAEYRQAREVMADADELPRTYSEWLKKAKRVERGLRAKGTAVTHVIVEPETFLAWCAQTGAVADAEARSEFASAEVARRFSKRGDER